MVYKIKKNEIGIFSMGRLASKRCKHKMVKKFAETTLTDIILSKLSKLGKNTFFAAKENIFKKKCIKHKVRFLIRSQKSAKENQSSKIVMSFLKNENYKYFIFINGCFPNLRIQTIKRFIDICRISKKPTFAVFEKKNYFLDYKNKPINFNYNNLKLNTSKVRKIKEFSNMLYFFEKKYFLKYGRYWDWKKLKYLTIPYNLETTDIDTEEDFKLAEIIWKQKK